MTAENDMDSIPSDVIRSRALRRRLLEILKDVYSANVAAGLTPEELLRISRRSSGPFGWRSDDVNAELSRLAAAHLVEITSAGRIHARLTNEGVDFLDAGCPWAAIDKFSGGMDPGQ